jgi:YcxB-like protein
VNNRLAAAYFLRSVSSIFRLSPSNLLQYLCCMTTNFFTYDKRKVIQALRFHFITRREIKTMIILVNVFAIVSAALFFFKKITPSAFLISSLLWIALMISFWFIMPNMVYKRAATFKDRLKAIINNNEFRIETNMGGRSWGWNEISNWMESPHFFHVYFNSRSFFIVPKDAFEGDDVHEARKILAEKIKKS